MKTKQKPANPSIKNSQERPATREDAEKLLKKIYSRKRCSDPVYATPDKKYLKSLDDESLKWLADFEAMSEGNLAATARLCPSPELRAEISSDRYFREETVRNAAQVDSLPPWEISGLCDQMGQPEPPFIEGGYRKPRKKKQVLH